MTINNSFNIIWGITIVDIINITNDNANQNTK